MSILFDGAGSIEDVLQKEGVIAAVTSGISMEPLFKTHRDMVILKKSDRALKKYDVALYKSGNNYVLHRIIKVIPKDKTYIIRGDNTYSKEKVPFDAPLAYLVSFNRKGKSVSCERFSYRFYSVLWNFLYPIRYVIRLFKLALRRIFKKKK